MFEKRIPIKGLLVPGVLPLVPPTCRPPALSITLISAQGRKSPESIHTAQPEQDGRRTRRCLATTCREGGRGEGRYWHRNGRGVPFWTGPAPGLFSSLTSVGRRRAGRRG